MAEEDGTPTDIILLVASVITCTLCLAVILTTFCFKSMRSKFFMNVICMISFCDFLGNLAEFYPIHHNRCTFHGMWYYFFFGASYSWTVLLSYLLYGLAKEGKVVLKMRTLHMIAWSSASVRGFLPYTSSVYIQKGIWCDIGTRPGDSQAWAVFWNILVYPVWIGATFLIIIYLRWKILFGIKSGEISMTPTVRIAIDTLQMYPLALIICWTPRYLIDILYIAGIALLRRQDIVNAIVMTLCILHGAIISSIFFWKSSEARKSWARVRNRAFSSLSSIHQLMAVRGNERTPDRELSMQASDLQQYNASIKSQIRKDDIENNAVFTQSILHMDDYYNDLLEASDSFYPPTRVKAVGTPNSTPHTSVNVPSEVAQKIATIGNPSNIEDEEEANHDDRFASTASFGVQMKDETD